MEITDKYDWQQKKRSEIREYKAAKRESVTYYATCFVVSKKFILDWKRYIGFEEPYEVRSLETINSLHPGSIDCTDLQGTEEGSLKRGIEETKDFEFLPDWYYKELVQIYEKRGPEFQVFSVNKGTKYIPNYSFELYPMQLRVFVCSSDRPEVGPEDTSSAVVIKMSKYVTLEECKRRLHQDPKLGGSRPMHNGYFDSRIWVKSIPSEIEVVQSEPREEPHQDSLPLPASDDFNERDMTLAVTALCLEPWRMCKVHTSRLLDMFPTADTADIIMETASKLHYDDDFVFPRDALAQEWKQGLRVGDVVDARHNSSYSYRAARVVSVSADSGSVVVHFKGYPPSTDEEISKNEISAKIFALYTKTKNWRAKLEDGDRVDLQVAGRHQKMAWVSGEVKDVDKAKGRVLVEYSASAAADKIKEANGCFTPTAVVAVVSVVEEDNQDRVPGADMEGPDEFFGNKKAGGGGEGSSEVDQPTPTYLEKWLSLNSDDLCEVNTHVQKKWATSTTSITVYSSNMGKMNNAATTTLDDEDDWRQRSHVGTPLTRGAVGLQNLGNTCFMNSILQCLSNTAELTEVFSSGRYKEQINRTNTLGCKGRVAESYAKLVKDMWNDGYRCVVPSPFKKVIGEFQTQFSGYEQQDAHEFLGFVLDGLHEDLNRKTVKPHVNKIESKGRDDSVISREAWRRFLLRNDSEIVDRMHGQLRSHVTCTNCGKESVTFEAFSCLSLPIPVKTAKPVTVLVYLLPLGTAPAEVTLEVEPTETVVGFKRRVVEQLVEAELLPAQPPAPAAASASVGGGGGEGDEGDVPSPSAPSEKVGAKGESVLNRLHFYSSSNWYDKGRVKENYADSDSVAGFLQGTDLLLVMSELGRTVPLKPRYVSYHQEGNLAPYVDLYFGISSLNYPQFLVWTDSKPTRVPITEETTQHELYEMAAQIVRRWVSPTSSYYGNASERPFRLVATNKEATVQKAVLKDTQELLNLAYLDCVVIVWKKEAKNEEDFERDGFNEKLSVEEIIKTKRSASAGAGGQKGAKEGGLTLFSCLDKFTEKEQLPATESLYCSQCKSHDHAPLKKMDLWSTPDVLIVQLKRFQYTPGTYFVHRDKISDQIDFPVGGPDGTPLDLSAYVKGPIDPAAPPVYNLYAVSQHSGGLGGGHYTATCRNPENGEWFDFNDSFVSRSSPSSALSPEAYVLFYRRATGGARWGGVTLPEEGMPDEE